MGASAVRLVVAELPPGEAPRILEEATRAVQLGRDAFTSGRLGAATIEATLRSLEGFRRIMDSLRGRPLPRGGDERRARGHQPGHVPRPGAPAHRDRRRGDRRLRGEPAQLHGRARGAARPPGPRRGRHAHGRGGRRKRRPLVPAQGRAHPLRARTPSGRSACARTSPRGTGATTSACASTAGPCRTSWRTCAGRCRCARRASSSPSAGTRASSPTRSSRRTLAHASARTVSRESFLAFCDETTALDDEQLVERYRLPLAELETLVPALIVYRELLAETQAESVLVPEASLRAGLLLDMVRTEQGHGIEDFSRQVLASRGGPRREVPLRRPPRAAGGAPRHAALRRAARRARPLRPRPAPPRGGGAPPRHRDLREPARPPQARPVHPLGLRDLRPQPRRHGDHLERRPLPPPRRRRTSRTCRSWPSTRRTACS